MGDTTVQGIPTSFRISQLVPESSVSRCTTSIHFYVHILGFSIAYRREEDGFAFLTLGDAQIMIDETGEGRTWKTASFEFPLGRGVHFQIEVGDVQLLVDRLRQNKVGLFMEAEDKWYRKLDHEVGNRQFLVQDPDGYLLRFTEDLGERPTGNG